MQEYIHYNQNLQDYSIPLLLRKHNALLGVYKGHWEQRDYKLLRNGSEGVRTSGLGSWYQEANKCE